MGYEVVIGVPLGERTAGVVRKDDGSLVFSGHVDARGGTVLTDFRPHGTSIDGQTVVAGRRPDGAARVVVIDDRGDEHEALLGGEAWVAVTGKAGFSEPLARFEDAAGALVPFPIPDGPRAPVGDADAACPICGGSAWIEVGKGVYCERCGLQVGADRFFLRLELPADELVSEDEEEEDDDWEAEERREQARVIASVDFPVYGVPGREWELGGYGGDPGKGIKHVGVRHLDGARQLAVTSKPTPEWGDGDDLRRHLAHMVGAPDRVDRSEAALRVHSTDADRIVRRRVARADLVTRAFVIDDEPEPFTFIALDDVWTAHRDHFGVTVRLSAHGVDPAHVELAPVAGPASSAALSRRAQAGRLLTRAEVAALIEEHGQGERREVILAGIRPGYRLTADPAAPHRIGGEPDLVPGEHWPHDEDGIPYTFLAQIDCSQLPPIVSEFPVPEWNHGGRLLRFFAPFDGRVGEPDIAIALACAPDAPRTRTPVPPRPDPMPADAWEPDDDSMRELEEQPMRVTPFLTSREPPYESELVAALHAGGARPRSRREWVEGPQLLGHAANVQGEDPALMGHYVYEDTAEDDWGLLLYLSPETLDFGDGGAIALLIRHEDLAAGRYDRLATDTSMG
jgi:hypothetical protein